MVVRRQRYVSRVGHDEAAGAIGALGHPGLEAGLADQCGLLVARDAAHGYLPAQAIGARNAIVSRAVANLGQHRPRNAERGQQVIVPVLRMDIEEQRTRRVGRIGSVDSPARQSPEQERVNRAEGELARFGALANALDVVQDPRNLGTREIGVEPQSRLFGHRGFDTVILLRLAVVRCAAILPDNGIEHGFARFPVPDHGRLTLIRDADRRDIRRRRAGLLHRALRDRGDALPDSLGIVLDPAGLRVYLRKLLLFTRDDIGVVVVDDSAAAAGALVDGKQKFSSHDDSGLTLNSGCLTCIVFPASAGHGCTS